MYTSMDMRRTAARKTPPTTLSIAEVRANLPDVVRRAEQGEVIRITRRGVPVAVVQSLRTEDDVRAERFRALVARMCSTPRPDDGPADPWADIRDRTPDRPVADLGG